MGVTAHSLVTVSQIHVQQLVYVPLPAVDPAHITMTVDAPVTLSVIQGSALRQPTHANQVAILVRIQAHTVKDVIAKVPACVLQEHVILMLAHLRAL